MASWGAFVSVCFTFLLTANKNLVVGKVDLTTTPGASGSAVVEAVIDVIQHSCIFDDDKFFLRRLAFVESRDGTNGNTYRHGYDGGIWQVDKDRFHQTQVSNYAKKYFYKIRTSTMRIDWTLVTWSDLRRPLYSGLAARLYVEVMMQGRGLPRDITQQADVWHQHYHNSNPAPTSNFTATAKLLTQSQTCTGGVGIDTVFMLDSSGSVDEADFEKAKQFVLKWIEAFTFGPKDTQLGVIAYSTEVHIQFYLNSFYNKQELIANVKGIEYSGGGTSTDVAITVAVNTVLSRRHGGRDNVGRAAILVTDGQSYDREATAAAAKRARDQGVTMYAVGVGSNIDLTELQDVATDPDCTHVFLVQDYSKIQDLKEQMQKATCETKIQVQTPNKPGSGENVTTEVECEMGKTCKMEVPPGSNATAGSNTTSNGTAFVTTVNCGSATVYAAYNNPNPGLAYYEIKKVATEGNPAVINLDGEGRGGTLYITVQGQSYRIDVNSTVVCKAVSSVMDKNKIPDGKVAVQCVQNGAVRQCTSKDLTEFKDKLCEVSWEFPNPCTRQHLIDGVLKYPHPHHLDRYLLCDFTGNVYIVQCPQGYMYHHVSGLCAKGVGTPGNLTSGRYPLEEGMTNPCTVAAIYAGHLLFADVKDDTRFISCDVWGTGWLNHCPDGFIWDPKDMRCVVESSSGHVQGPGALEPDVPNPCTKEHIAARLFFWPYPRASDRYIQCDLWGDAFVMLCFVGGHWNDAAGSCTAG